MNCKCGKPLEEEYPFRECETCIQENDGVFVGGMDYGEGCPSMTEEEIEEYLEILSRY
jgi:hypothetical protein